MHKDALTSHSRTRSLINEGELLRRGGKLAPTTFWWKVPQVPCHLYRSTGTTKRKAQVGQDGGANTGNLSPLLRRLTRRHVAKDAYRTLAALVVFIMSSVACGEVSRGLEEGLRVAEVGRSYPFHQVERDPWAMPTLFNAPGYDTEWTHSDEQGSEDSLDSEISEQLVEEPPSSLCGNAIVEEGEACDLGQENGLWDEGRALEALCTLTCQDPVWRGDLYLEEVSHRRLESLWVIDGDVHLDAHLPWGLMWRSVREIRGNLHFHHDSPVIHVDLPLLRLLGGSIVLDEHTAPHLESFQAPRLLRIGSDLRVQGHENLEALELDQLTHINGNAVVTGNTSLDVLHLPVLQRVEDDFKVIENPSLCEPWEMFEDWQWVSVYGEMELTRSDACPFVVSQEG